MISWPDPTSRSRELYDRGLKVLPGGITRTLPWQEPFPVYAARGEGPTSSMSTGRGASIF